MKLAIVSDLHWEHEIIVPLDRYDFDVLLCVGDVLAGHDSRDPIEQLAGWSKGKPVLFVPGNHEFECRGIREAVARLKSSAACFAPHIRVLYNDMVEMDEVRFLGTTLWTDFSLYGKDTITDTALRIRHTMPDFKIRRADGLGLSVKEVRAEHQTAVAFLQQHLATPHPNTVVLSHFAPSPRSIAPKYKTSPLNAWFANNLPDKLIAQADLWVHGHTHTSFDYPVEHDGKTCRVVCNPSGFTQEFSLDGQRPEVQQQWLSLFPQLATQPVVLVKENPEFVSPLIVEL